MNNKINDKNKKGLRYWNIVLVTEYSLYSAHVCCYVNSQLGLLIVESLGYLIKLLIGSQVVKVIKTKKCHKPFN